MRKTIKDPKYSISLLTNILKCSRSGYYDWLKLGRPHHKKYNQKRANLILEQHKKATNKAAFASKLVAKLT